jgi:hypothetical protein
VAIKTLCGSALKLLIARFEPHEPFQHRKMNFVVAFVPVLAFPFLLRAALANIMRMARPTLIRRFQLCLLAAVSLKRSLGWLLQESV